MFETMGIALTWNQQNQTITGQKGSMSFTLKVGSTKAVLNGKEIKLDKLARVVQGNTLVPLRFVGEATGGLVVWDPKKPRNHDIFGANAEPAWPHQRAGCGNTR
ncbi:copper amine oxidase N-terminal domain-containing protein [Paenibacillus sp. JTLBN-2024]